MALALSERLPQVLDGLKCGRINLYKASIIHSMTEYLDPVDAAKVAAEVLKKAPTQTGAQVRNRVRQLASRIKTDADPPAGSERAPHLTRDTLTRLGEAPGHIDGLGYVAGWVIRDLVQDAAGREGTALRGIIYDDTTGTFLAATTPKYRLPTWLNEHIKHRDMTCRFPGCRKSAQRCDIDHVKAWHKGGVTEECNLQCLCRAHHRLKQSPGWRVRYEGGTAIWTAPTGHEYISEPHDYRDSSPFSDPSSEPPDDPTGIPADIDIGTDYEPPPDNDREPPDDEYSGIADREPPYVADYGSPDIADHEYSGGAGGEPAGGWLEEALREAPPDPEYPED